MMKRLAILLTLLFSLTCCKGPKSGPLSKESFDKPKQEEPTDMQKSPGPAQPAKADISVTPCDGCVKISDLMAEKKTYAGKVISVTGQVVKYNPEIMGKNWIHIQDGSEYQGVYDLTVTSDQPAKVGDIMTFEGRIAIDKDFGYGYFYPVIMEDARVKK